MDDNDNIYHESDEMRAQAREKHISGDTPAAIMLLAEAIKKEPGNVGVAIDMVQIFIDTDQIEDAKGLFSRLPVSAQDSEMGKSISGQLLFKDLAAKTAGIATLNEKLQQTPDDSESRFDLAVCQVAEYEYKQAMDNLFIIQEADEEYKKGAAREMIITIVNMLMPTAPELAQEYRRKLSNIL